MKYQLRCNYGSKCSRNVREKSIAAPILISPITESYERICIGAVSVIENDIHVGVIGLPASLAKMSYKIELVVMQLKNYLKNGNALSDFEPMFSDFFLGPEEYGNFGMHKDAIEAVLRNNSYLWKGE